MPLRQRGYLEATKITDQRGLKEDGGVLSHQRNKEACFKASRKGGRVALYCEGIRQEREDAGELWMRGA